MYHRNMSKGRDMREALVQAKLEASMIPESRKKQYNEQFDAARNAAQVQATFRR